jgi:hypothetical protein
MKIKIQKATVMIILMIISLASITCKKDKLTENNPTHPVGDSYINTQDFLNQNAVKPQFFTFDNAVGGTFTSSKGSQIIITPNTFTAGGSIVTGNVTLEFKDIYHKSDMILSQMPTTLTNGGLLESGGMFYIKVMQGSQILSLLPGNAISINLPIDSNSVPVSSMAPYIFSDTSGINGWTQSYADSLYNNVYYYTYMLYNLYSGSWYNCDSPGPFAGFTQTLLTLHQTDTSSLYGTQVFLVFPGYNTMISLYSNNNDFICYSAPVGLNCIMLAIRVKNSKLYYSKQDFIITQNSTVNFSMTQTTKTALINLLNTLNN